jgi:hypothetical protein
LRADLSKLAGLSVVSERSGKRGQKEESRNGSFFCLGLGQKPQKLGNFKLFHVIYVVEQTH